MSIRSPFPDHDRPGNRLRACAALLHSDHILMVRHQESERSYWTLPGGAVETGETPQQAAVREVEEETGLRARVVRFLFEESYLAGTSTCQCFLLEIEGNPVPTQGYDPEEVDKAPHERLLQEVAWLPLQSLKYDGQVAQVLEALAQNTKGQS